MPLPSKASLWPLPDGSVSVVGTPEARVATSRRAFCVLAWAARTRPLSVTAGRGAGRSPPPARYMADAATPTFIGAESVVMKNLLLSK